MFGGTNEQTKKTDMRFSMSYRTPTFLPSNFKTKIIQAFYTNKFSKFFLQVMGIVCRCAFLNLEILGVILHGTYFKTIMMCGSPIKIEDILLLKHTLLSLYYKYVANILAGNLKVAF